MPDVYFFFRDWDAVARVALIAALGYVALLVFMRATGQRTLARMTPFDFILTVTLGSAFGRVLTAENVPLLEVVVAFAALVVLRWAVASLRARLPAFARLVTPEPALLYHDGRFLWPAMNRHRITEADLVTAARQNGLGALSNAQAVILESDGSFAVVTPSQVGDGSAIEHLGDRR